ncbi:peptidylprolyl isomerase fpr4 [Tulasnella sp. 424]|nr:peptidylprolyl isomerase fpr4 [Tulasnella sp. 424]KAG8975537.1 peptidylprolyl isomerase fpr4 [Tulasnella sp. 425]
MAVSIAIWSQVLTPGRRVRVIPGADFRLTTATFGEDVVDEKGRSTIKLYRLAMPEDDEEDDEEEDEDEDEEKELTFEKEPVVIGHLIPGKIESQLFDLVFSEEEPVEFEITGKNKIHLVGNYIDQNPLPLPDGEYDSEGDDDAYDLDEVSSDVAMDPNDLLMEDSDSDESVHATIEEVKEKEVVTKSEKKDKKRPRESTEGEAEVEVSKKDKKKKQKLESGAAAPVNGDAEKKESKKEDKKEKDGKKEKKKTIRTTKSGVTVDVRTEGKGPAAKNGQKLSMRYIGKLQNGHVFDKNVKGSPFTFTLGKGEVIKGWDEGLAGLNVGTEAVLTIPPSAAYGNKKMDDIPANSTLTFEVKVLSIK